MICFPFFNHPDKYRLFSTLQSGDIATSCALNPPIFPAALLKYHFVWVVSICQKLDYEKNIGKFSLHSGNQKKELSMGKNFPYKLISLIANATILIFSGIVDIIFKVDIRSESLVYRIVGPSSSLTANVFAVTLEVGRSVDSRFSGAKVNFLVT